MSEALLRVHLIRGMGHSWAVQRHEDKFSIGIPDLSYSILGVNGWIELKYHRKKPKLDRLIKVKYPATQREWLKKHGKVGGFCWIFYQVHDVYFLIQHIHADTIPSATFAQLVRVSTQMWHKDIDFNELHNALVTNPAAAHGIT